MKVIVQKVYKVEYSTKYFGSVTELVEANSLVEAIEVSTTYHEKDKDSNFRIKSVSEHIPILKPISKIVTKTLTVEL